MCHNRKPFYIFLFLIFNVVLILGFQVRFKFIYRLNVTSLFFVEIPDKSSNGRTKPVLVNPTVCMNVSYIGGPSYVALFDFC